MRMMLRAGLGLGLLALTGGAALADAPGRAAPPTGEPEGKKDQPAPEPKPAPKATGDIADTVFAAPQPKADMFTTRHACMLAHSLNRF